MWPQICVIFDAVSKSDFVCPEGGVFRLCFRIRGFACFNGEVPQYTQGEKAYSSQLFVSPDAPRNQNL